MPYLCEVTACEVRAVHARTGVAHTTHVYGRFEFLVAPTVSMAVHGLCARVGVKVVS